MLWRLIVAWLCVCVFVFLCVVLVFVVVLLASGSWARAETAVGTALCVRRHIGHYHRCLLDVLVQWLDRPAQPSGEMECFISLLFFLFTIYGEHSRYVFFFAVSCFVVGCANCGGSSGVEISWELLATICLVMMVLDCSFLRKEVGWRLSRWQGLMRLRRRKMLSLLQLF